MLLWALTFLLVAVMAAFLGFGALAGGAASIARVLLVLFAVMSLISVVTHGVDRKRRAPL